MLSKHDQYFDCFSRCMTNAEGRDGEVRALWLSLADSYRMLLHYEHTYPTIVRDGFGQTYKSESDVV